MRNIRKDLIEQEFKFAKESNSLLFRELSFRPFKLSNRFIRHLFNNYYVEEFTEHYYDSDPAVNPRDLLDKYLAYRESPYNIPAEKWDEYRKAYEKVCRIIKNYENQRLEKLVWIEVFSEGVNGWSQARVDEISMGLLSCLKSGLSVSSKDRLYLAGNDDVVLIYYYGRDCFDMDLWWIFKKRKNKIKKIIKK